MQVVNNSSIPTSALKNRHNTIYYHRVREDQASGILKVGWITGEFNLSDLFTKTTTSENKIHDLVESIFSNTASQIGSIDQA